MEIQKIGTEGALSKVVIRGNFAFVSGLTSRVSGTLAAETADILAQYEEIFEKTGIKKENALFAYTFLYDMTDSGYGEVWQPWVGADNPPSGVCVRSDIPDGKKIVISLTFAV